MTTREPIIQCPHCKTPIYIAEINCGIFRHGVFKDSGEQIPPHSLKSECDRYVSENLIYGCGKPFRINVLQDIFVVEICEYV